MQSPQRSRNVRAPLASAAQRRPYAPSRAGGGGGGCARLVLRVLASAALGASLAVVGVGVSRGLGAHRL